MPSLAKLIRAFRVIRGKKNRDIRVIHGEKLIRDIRVIRGKKIIHDFPATQIVCGKRKNTLLQSIFYFIFQLTF